MEHEKVYGLYENFEDAASTISELVRGGFSSENITVIVNDEDGRLEKYTTGEFSEDAVEGDEGAGFGAVVGTLTSLGILALPGVGPVFAAGPLAAALIAGIGAATGATMARVGPCGGDHAGGGRVFQRHVRAFDLQDPQADCDYVRIQRWPFFSACSLCRGAL